METIKIPTRPSRYKSQPGHWREQEGVVLQLKGTRRRYGLGYVDSTGECRRVYQGPILPGPYAFMTANAIVISAHKTGPAPVVIEFDLGDTVEFHDGQRFTIRKGRNFKEADMMLDPIGFDQQKAASCSS